MAKHVTSARFSLLLLSTILPGMVMLALARPALASACNGDGWVFWGEGDPTSLVHDGQTNYKPRYPGPDYIYRGGWDTYKIYYWVKVIAHAYNGPSLTHWWSTDSLSADSGSETHYKGLAGWDICQGNPPQQLFVANWRIKFYTNVQGDANNGSLTWGYAHNYIYAYAKAKFYPQEGLSVMAIEQGTASHRENEGWIKSINITWPVPTVVIDVTNNGDAWGADATKTHDFEMQWNNVVDGASYNTVSADIKLYATSTGDYDTYAGGAYSQIDVSVENFTMDFDNP